MKTAVLTNLVKTRCSSQKLDITDAYLAIANRTADHLGVKYYKKHMNEKELAARFEDATWHCEYHNPDLNYVGKYALSEVPQEVGFKVVLTGQYYPPTHIRLMLKQNRRGRGRELRRLSRLSPGLPPRTRPSLSNQPPPTFRARRTMHQDRRRSKRLLQIC
jgi:hypothetical protein